MWCVIYTCVCVECMHVCVVCVCEREREGKSEGEREQVRGGGGGGLPTKQAMNTPRFPGSESS